MLSPEEIRHVDLRLGIRGYDRRQVDELLAELREGYASTWNERTRLYDQVVELREELANRDATIDELAEEIEHLRAVQVTVQNELDNLKALQRVRAAGSEPGRAPEQARHDALRRDAAVDGDGVTAGLDDEDEQPLDETASIVPFRLTREMRHPLRDMPFDALKDYVMERFELHNRSNDSKENG